MLLKQFYDFTHCAAMRHKTISIGHQSLFVGLIIIGYLSTDFIVIDKKTNNEMKANTRIDGGNIYRFHGCRRLTFFFAPIPIGLGPVVNVLFMLIIYILKIYVKGIGSPLLNFGRY